MDKSHETNSDAMNRNMPGEMNSREIVETSAANISLEKIMAWSEQFNPFVLLNSNKTNQTFNDEYSAFDLLIAAGSIENISTGNNIFNSIRTMHEASGDWIFGYLAYDLKNQVEKLSSANMDGINACNYFLFRPRFVLAIKGDKLTAYYSGKNDSEDSVKKMLKELNDEKLLTESEIVPEIHQRINHTKYIENVEKIKTHIKRGDIYEMNYCIEFYSPDAYIKPASVYSKLNHLSPMPFSAYMNCGIHYLMSASPERYLAKRGTKIISQPIKGTARRSSNKSEDEQIMEALRNDKKEQSENVMIVDLVRNDLSRTAAKGSVTVEELFGIKSFTHLHHMASTVTSEIDTDIHFTEVIRKSFPMGSMTGAPKIRAMELIEFFEDTKRGIYSGAVGYISPDGNFDFNVIIRSVLYNSQTHYLSFMAGSAITAGSDAEKEYQECLLKVEGMKRVLMKK